MKNNIKNNTLISLIVILFLVIGTMVVGAANYGSWGWGWYNVWPWYWMMWGANLSEEDYNDMIKMRELIHSDKNLTEEEFKWLIEEQKEYMWYSPLERFASVDEYNKYREENVWFWWCGMGMRGQYNRWIISN